MSRPQDADPEDDEPLDVEDGAELDPDELIDSDDLEDALEGDEDSDEESEDESDEDAPKKSSKKKPDEEDPPGPDVPAPPKKKLRAAMEWAFQNETIAPELLDKFAEHAHMLLEANRQVEMTSVLDPKEVAAKLYLDSWRVTQMMSLLGRSVVDLGSGAGFPGLPIALEEVHTRVTLADLSEKKAAFLAECIEKLGVKNAKVHFGKAEELLATERCDVVVVRALSSVRENVRTLRKVRQSLKDLVMLKGASWSREVRAGEREAERLGFTLDTVWEHELPDDMGKRAILIYRAPGGQGL
jgi:16S rRNA (guanine527-N7)-methyltransferase